MYRLGQLTSVKVNDEVTVMLAIDWGQYKKLLREIDELPDDDPTTLDKIGEKICAHIHSIEGVEDAQGNPIAEITPEVLNTFPPSLARELVRAVQRLGVAEDDAVPPAEGSDS